MNRWDELMDEYYFEIEEAVPMTAEEQERILQAALYGKTGKGSKQKMRKKHMAALIAAALVGATALTAGAVSLFHLDKRIADLIGPVSEQQIADLEEAASPLSQSVTDQGWTMQLLSTFGDSHSAYIVFDMIAPQGTVLNGDQYRFETPYLMMQDSSLGYSIESLEDDDKTDNRIRFVLQMNTQQDINGQNITLNFNNLQQYTQQEMQTIVNGTWKTEIQMDYKDLSFSVPADQKIPLLGGTVEVHSLLVSPLSVTVEMQGDLIKQMDEEPPAPGESTEANVTLYFKDGSTLNYDASHAAEDDMLSAGSSIEGRQQIQTVSFRHMIDVGTLESIQINGVDFPVS